MPYWQLFYHLIWATKRREPLMTPAVAPEIYGFLRSKAIGLGATVFAVNGVADHVHMVVAIPPRLAVATFIGQVKGVASAKVNKAGLIGTPFYWQEEYGVFSFDAKRLPNFIAYVERQQQHHADYTAIRVNGVPVEDEPDDDALPVATGSTSVGGPRVQSTINVTQNHGTVIGTQIINQARCDRPPSTPRAGRRFRRTRRRGRPACAGAPPGGRQRHDSRHQRVRGMGGIGKTELAYVVAQQLKDAFPDAQLLVELRGATSNPLPPAQAHQAVIRAFEREAKLPLTA